MDDVSNSLRAIFTEALEKNDAAARDDYLAQACGLDAVLRHRVEDLLHAHQTAGGFLKGPDDYLGEDPPASRVERLPEAAGDHIGRYKLIEKIGEGGCGTVYRAEQTEPVRRQVALKVIKLGMDTRSVIARFEAERQALALMDHLNIARVFDAGATEAGRPFFVMELVRGIKITDYCDQNNLSTRARLTLFVQVCHAIQHAHQKGIIHRDIKPSNILVTQHEGPGSAGCPKVIDFGIAKATTDLQLTDKTLFTQFELLLGTPAYMSPEQAEMGRLDIDTRTDIYSLGVLLYELLTGRTPFDTQVLLKSGLEMLRRTIREKEPTRPSTRLRTLTAADLSEAARLRQSEPLKLISLVRGDLDWLVLKALQKDRARRYETASALAADVQRYLRDEPILARPPSRLYALGKQIRRNKFAVAAAVAVAMALLVGLGVATVALVKEHRARQMANARAEESRQRLVRLNVAAGNKLVGEGDDFNALLWFIEALRLDEAHASCADIHRRRIGAILGRVPRLAQFWAHESLVRGAEFSPDGERVVSASWDGSAKIWDARTGSLAVGPLRHATGLESAQFALDGRRILTMDRDGQVRLWNAQTGEPVPLPMTDAKWAALDVSPDGLWFLAGVTNGVQLFDTAHGAVIRPAVALTNKIQVLHFSPDGRGALVGGAKGDALMLEMPSGQVRLNFPDTHGLRGVGFSSDGRRVATLTLREVRVWDISTGEMTLPVLKPGGDLFECQFSPDGRRLVVASWAGFARMFDAATGLPIGLPMRHLNGVTRSFFSADGRWLATASRDGTARVWHPETGEPLSPLLPHAGFLFTASFAPDGGRLLTASQDWTARLWELRTNRVARLVLHHGGHVRQAQFSPDGLRLFTAGGHGNVRIWDARTGQAGAILSHGSPVEAASFSPDGTRLITGTADGQVRVWDVNRAMEIFPALHLSNAIRVVAFNPDGHRILAAGGDRAGVWSAARAEAITPWLTHADLIRHAAFSPDGRRVVTAGRDAVGQIWHAETGALVGPPLKHPCEVLWAAFNHDGSRVVTACSDAAELPRFAQVWDAATGQALGPPMPHRDGVSHVEFSPDGRRIATASDDDTAMIWDSATGRALTAPLPHRDDLGRATFSPDGQLLLTISSDFTARVWDGVTGEPITPPLPHEGQVLWAAWRPNGREVVTGSVDNTARVWDVSPAAEPLTQLQRQAELLSAHRLEANIGPVALSAAEMQERWQALRERK